jgi:integrase
MASAWVETYTTPRGETRHRVKFTLGGRGSRAHHGGSFKRKADARVREAWVRGELAGMRVPNMRALDAVEIVETVTVTTAADAWFATRIDVASTTSTRHELELKRIKRGLGSRPVSGLTWGEVANWVAGMSPEYRRGTIRKTLQTLAMILDHAEVKPNPARDKRVRLPREELKEKNPPPAEHVAAVFRLLPTKHRLALLWLDWAGARVGTVDDVLVGDYDEPRRRVRLRAEVMKMRRAVWVELHPVLADAIEERLGPREDRDHDARLFADSGADALRTAIGKACKAAGIPLWSPHDLRDRRISLLHAQGKSWAQIGELVGNESKAVLADTYTHVLADETELDYAELLGR